MLNPFDPSDKRPKLERARSAAEKENQPLQRTSSMLRRQYSQQEPPITRRMSTSDSGVEVSPGQRRMQPKLPQPYQTHPQGDFIQHHSSSLPSQRSQVHPYNQSSQMGPSSSSYGSQNAQYLGSHPGQSGSVSYPDEDPRYYQASF